MSWLSQPSTKHILQITASASYDVSTQTIVPVNTETPLHVSSPLADIELIVRIKDFVGSEAHAGHPKTSPYFDKRVGTNISIQVNLTPRGEPINGDELVFGNDFGYPIKDFLPYGAGAGLKLFQTYVDPSVVGDLYSEKPFLYGKALSSFNAIQLIDEIEEPENDEDGITLFVEEGLQNQKPESEKLIIPIQAPERQKFFQDSHNQALFTLLPGKTYMFDFFSGLVSLKESQFNINLPGGFSLNLSRYLNNKFNTVRFVLKKIDGDLGVENGEVLLVITFAITDVIEETSESDQVESSDEVDKP